MISWEKFPSFACFSGWKLKSSYSLSSFNSARLDKQAEAFRVLTKSDGMCMHIYNAETAKPRNWVVVLLDDVEALDRWQPNRSVFGKERKKNIFSLVAGAVLFANWQRINWWKLHEIPIDEQRRMVTRNISNSEELLIRSGNLLFISKSILRSNSTRISQTRKMKCEEERKKLFTKA